MGTLFASIVKKLNQRYAFEHWMWGIDTYNLQHHKLRRGRNLSEFLGETLMKRMYDDGLDPQTAADIMNPFLKLWQVHREMENKEDHHDQEC